MIQDPIAEDITRLCHRARRDQADLLRPSLLAAIVSYDAAPLLEDDGHHHTCPAATLASCSHDWPDEVGPRVQQATGRMSRELLDTL